MLSILMSCADPVHDCNIDTIPVQEITPVTISEGPQFKIYLRFIKVGLPFAEHETEIINSVEYANYSIPFLDFNILFVERLNLDIQYQDLFLGTDTELLTRHNADDVINVYIMRRNPSYDYVPMAHIVPFSQYAAHNDRLCYLNTEYKAGELSSEYDQEFVDPNTIILSYEALLSETALTHELGHYFNLRHCRRCLNCYQDDACSNNMMADPYISCDKHFTKSQLDTMYTFLPYRYCIVHSLDHQYFQS